MSRLNLGVAWYSRATWHDLKAVAPDAAELEPTYEAWVAVYEDGIEHLRAGGYAPQRVEIELPALLAWCAKEGCVPDSSSRAAFASELLRLRDLRARGPNA